MIAVPDTPRLDDLDIVVPVRNEGSRLTALLDQLAAARAAGAVVTVVDGESDDDTVARARAGADRVLRVTPSRGAQLAAGCAAGERPWLWLLHADSRLDARHPWAVQQVLAQGAAWGRFEVQLDAAAPALRLVATAMNLRTRLTGIVTGDHGIFCRRAALVQVGGMPALPLMEDIELSRRLRRLGRPACIGPAIVTSARRWQRDGVLRTVLTMWQFRLRYWCGASAEQLAREYYRGAR